MRGRSRAWVWHAAILGLVALGLVGVALVALPGSSHHKRLVLGLDLRGGLQVVLKAEPPAGHQLTPYDMDRSLLVMRHRIDRIGVSGAELRKQGQNAIVTTTFITLLPIGALLFFGGATLTGFAFALLVGVISGAYSSIFIAAPLLYVARRRAWQPADPYADASPESALAALQALSRALAPEE